MSADKLVGQKFGNYQLERRIGAGAMGYVYLAKHVGLNKPAAIKIMSPSLIGTGTNVERFLQEARMAASLEHPNVVQVFDVGEENGLYYMAMQYVDGQSLDKLLDGRKKLDVHEAGGIVKKIALALAAAHKLGIVHRDIKPANVLLSKDGQIKVADFGLARSNDASLSVSGQIIGTPYYMSPEQGQGKPVDGRADLYSLGATYYHLVTGRRPFEGDTQISIILKHVNEAPVPPDRIEPSVPSGISRLIMKLMAKNPDDRFPGGEDFVRAHVAVEGGAPAPEPPPMPRVPDMPAPDVGPGGASRAGGRSLTSVPMTRDYQTKDNSPEAQLKAEGKPVVGKYLLIREIQKQDDDLSIWEAENIHTQARVSLRALTGHDSDRIRAFYKLAAEGTHLKHPNILHVMECHSDTDKKGKVTHFMAVELVRGQPLKSVVASRTLPLRSLLQLGVQLAQALEFAHQRRRLNLVLSPREVQVELPSRAVLSFQNFGSVEKDDARARLEALEAAPFLAPEQVPNVDDTVDATTDVYRLGALLYWMATGRSPFEASSLADYYNKILSVNPRSPKDLDPQVDAELDRLITMAMRKEKRLRYQKAGDVALALQKYLKTEPKEAPSSGQHRRALKASPKERLRLVFAQHGRRIVWIAVAAVLAIGGTWGWREWRPRWEADTVDTQLRRARLDAQAKFQDGKYAAALEACERVLAITPADVQMVALAKACRRKTLEAAVPRGVSGLEEASEEEVPGKVAALERAVRDLLGVLGPSPTPDDVPLVVMAGLGAFAAGDLEQASALLEKAGALDSKDPAAGLTLARAYFARVVHAAAVARMLKGADRAPEWRILMTDAVQRPAEPARQGADDDLAGAYAALGRGELERVKALAAAALDKGPSASLAAEARILRAWASGGDDNADLDAAIRARRSQTLAYVVRALRHADRGRAQAAVSDLTEAARLRPSRPIFILLRAKARQNAGDLEGAKTDLARAKALAGKDWEYEEEIASLDRALSASK